MSERAPLCLLSCDSARDLADGVAATLGMPLTPGREVWFASGEGKYVIEANLRGTDVYVFQRCLVPGGRSAYDNLVMALHAADAARLADADRVTLVLPYLPGTRQDKRKGHVREGVSTGLFARMFEAAGVSMVVTVEPHNEALIGCYDPSRTVLECVSATRSLSRFLGDEGLVGEVVASTDVGGLELARAYANRLGCDLAALSKERDYSEPSSVAKTTVLGDVAGRDVLIVDDIIDTAGSVVSAANALWDAGAAGILLAAVHPVLSPPAMDRLKGLQDEAARRGVRFALACTDAVVHPPTPVSFRTLSLVGLLAEVVRSINSRGSVRAAEG